MKYLKILIIFLLTVMILVFFIETIVPSSLDGEANNITSSKNVSARNPEHREKSVLVPIKLSYDINNDTLIVSSAGGTPPYHVTLLNNRDSIIAEIPNLSIESSTLIAGLDNLPQGEYLIKVRDDSGEEVAMDFKVNSLASVSCVNDLSDEAQILNQAKNKARAWFGYVECLRAKKKCEDPHEREETIGYAKSLFIDSLRQIEYISGNISNVTRVEILHEYLRNLRVNQNYDVVEINISDFHIIEDWELDTTTQTLIAKAKFISNYQGFREMPVKRDIVTYEQTLVYSEQNTKTVELIMKREDCPDKSIDKLIPKGCCVILLGDFKTLE